MVGQDAGHVNARDYPEYPGGLVLIVFDVDAGEFGLDPSQFFLGLFEQLTLGAESVELPRLVHSFFQPLDPLEKLRLPLFQPDSFLDAHRFTPFLSGLGGYAITA